MSSETRVEALREELVDDKRELRSAIAELETVARRKADPHEWIRRRPLSLLGGAFLLGWWMGSR